MPGVRAARLAADLVLLQDRQNAGQPQGPVAPIRNKRIVRVVAEQALGVRRASHDDRAVRGPLGRDAHGCAFSHAAPFDGDGFAAGEVNVAGRAAGRVSFDGRVAREVERAVAEDAAAVCGGRVADDASAAHGERAVIVDAAAAAVADRVAGDVAVPNSQGAAVVNAASCLSTRMGNLASLLAVVAVGDGQGRAAIDLDGIFAIRPGDGLAVEAELDVVGALPGVGEADVRQQVVVAVPLDVAQAPDGLPFERLAVPGVRAARLAADLVLLQDRQNAGQPQGPVAPIRNKRIVRVVAEQALGVRRASHDDRAVRGPLGRDAHGCAFSHAAPFDGDGFAAGEVNVAGRAAGRVSFDGRVAREVERAVAEDAAAVCGGRVADDASAAHGERAVIVDAAAAAVADRVAGDVAVPEGEGALVVDTPAEHTALMGNFADSLTGAVISNSQRRAAVDFDGIITAGPGNAIAVEAELDIGVAFPGGREGHIAGQVVITCGIGQAVCAGPTCPRQLVAVVLRAPVHTANLMLVRNRGRIAKFQTIVAVTCKRKSLVVAKEAFSIGRASHDRGALPGFLRRDAHGRASAHAASCDSDRCVATKLNVIDRAAKIVATDSHITREVKRAATANTAT